MTTREQIFLFLVSVLFHPAGWHVGVTVGARALLLHKAVGWEEEAGA